MSPSNGHKTRFNMELPTIRISENNQELFILQNLLDITSWCNKTVTDENGITTSGNLPDLNKVLLKQYDEGDIKEQTPFSGNTK